MLLGDYCCAAVSVYPVCENVNMSDTLGKDVSTITFSACNAVWLTTTHIRKNYQKGTNYTTIKSTSAVA